MGVPLTSCTLDCPKLGAIQQICNKEQALAPDARNVSDKNINMAKIVQVAIAQRFWRWRSQIANWITMPGINKLTAS